MNNLRFAFRQLHKNPGFTFTVVLTLSLGIGAIAVVFGVVNAVLLQPLPYPQADRIVSIAGRFAGIGIPDERNRLSAPEFVDLRRFSSAFSEISVVQSISYSIRAGELPERVGGTLVSANFFRLMGISPQIGRAFLAEEEQTGRDTVVVLGHSLWQRRFGADRNAIGRSLEINGRSYTIVGVMPPGFDYPPQSEMWTPLAFTEAQLAPNARGNHSLIGLARIKPGLTFEQADADMDRVTRQIAVNAPNFPYKNFHFRILIQPILEDLVGGIRPAMGMLMGAAIMVLLIACANAANLLLVRASSREREIGIRTALGATRWYLVRQLLVESTILSAVAAAVGVGLAWIGIRVIAGIGSRALPRLAQARLDWETLLFAAGVALVTGILFGIVPALQVSRLSANESLKEGGRSSTAGKRHQRLRRLFVTAEVALSLTLLIGAGLLIQSLLRLQDVNPGFKAEGVLSMRVVLPQAQYGQPDTVRAFYRRLVERISQIPGVESFGAINSLPLTGQGGSGAVTLDTATVPLENTSPETDLRVVLPGFFQTMKTRLIAGRFFDERDSETAAPVAIIDETMAKSYWPGENAVGKRLKFGGRTSTRHWMTIIGVVEHIRYDSLERSLRVQLYSPHAQTPSTGMSLVLRTRTTPAAVVEAVQKTVMTMDPNRPVYAVRSMEELLTDSMMRRRIMTLLLAVFAGIALILAALGIYGVISYWVNQRAHEIGIRMTLGASRRCILQMVMGHVLATVLIGVALGLAGALGLSRILTTLLFHIGAADPWTYAMFGLGLLVVGMLAGLVPAFRAAWVDPIRTLRQE